MSSLDYNSDLLDSTYTELCKIWGERIFNHYPGLSPEPIRHITSLEQMRFRYRPDEPKLIMIEESHIRSPEWAESRWCFKSKGPAICYNPQFSQTKFWKFLFEAASITIGKGPNRPDHRKHVIHEMKSHGFWVVHLSMFALAGIDKLCGSKGFYSPEFCAEVNMLLRKKKKKAFRLTQLGGVDEPETIENDLLIKSYDMYTSKSLEATNCPILAIKGTPKDFCLSRPELADRVIDVDFEPKKVDLFIDIYREHCM